jgi:hypothetical protein
MTAVAASPLHLAPSKNGRALYVADAFAGAVKRIDLRTGGTTTVGDNLGFPAA